MDTGTPREVHRRAVKVGRAPSDGSVGRQLEESRIAAGLAHPGVVAVHDVFVEDGAVWIVMERCLGSLLDWVQAHGTVGARGLVEALGPLFEGLSETHEQEIIHRDIKPSNILVDERGRPKLGDFGVA